MKENDNISEILTEFGAREGFGVIGASLDDITKWLNERVPERRVKISVPYYDFNVRGQVSVVNREVHGVMPHTHLCGNRDECVEVGDTTTLFYGDRKVTPYSHLPFLAETNVYFVKDYADTGEELVIDLEDAPSWRTYL